MEPLFIFSPYTGKVIPVLGTGMEPADENYTSWILYLNSSAKWSDGEPFTADDVVFTVNMLKEHPDLQGASAVAKVKSVEALDSHTVLFNLTEPTPRFFSASAVGGFWVVPKHIWENVDPTTFKNYPDPVFTGPYKLVSASPEMIIYKRRDDYWGKLPEPEWVIWKYMGSEETAMQEFLSLEVDHDQNFPIDIVQEIMDKDPYARLFLIPDSCATALVFNNRRYPLNMSEFRWALNYAINRTKIVKYCWRGIAPIISVPWPTFNAIMRWADKNIIAKYNVSKYPDGNPELAIQMLENLGFKRDAEGWFCYPNGTRIHLTLLNSPAEWTEWHCFGQAVTEDLRAIGIDVTLEDPPSSTVFVQRWESGDFDLLAHTVSCENNDPFLFFITYRSDYPPGGWYGNNEGYNNTEFDQLVDELEKIPSDFNDPRARSLVSRLLEIWLRDLPSAPVTVHQYPLLYNEYYWTNWPTKENPYIEPYAGLYWFHEVLLNLKSTGRLPPNIVIDPLFGRINVRTRNIYYTTIAIVIIIIVAIATFYFKKKA